MTDLVLLGYVSRAFGIKGGVALKLINQSSDALMVGKQVVLKRNRFADRIMTIVALHDQDRVLFAEVGSRTEAEELKGAELWISRNDLPKLEDDEYYLFELMGAQVVDSDGNKLGEIIGFSSNNAQTLFDIKTIEGHTASIPNVKPIVQKIDLVHKLVTIDPPEGLLDSME